MANLKEVKGRIQSVISTQQITKAMKMVAAAKLRRAQDRIIQVRPFSAKLSAIMQNITNAIDTTQVENPYSEVREINRVLLVVVTSDRGLCGAFNSNIFRQVRSLIEEKYNRQSKNGGLYIMPIGKRSVEFFNKRGYQTISQFSGLMGKLMFDDVRDAAEFTISSFVEGRFDKVEIVYNEFKNVATQIVRAENFLPIANPELNISGGSSTDYIFEPNQSFIFGEVVPKSLKIQFYKALLESNAAENGARMTAMGQATDNAGELLKELKLTYNRTRQAAITKEILEIVGGAEALSQGS
jgi:F-type H+-transporting ATPase subunit gamma